MRIIAMLTLLFSVAPSAQAAESGWGVDWWTTDSGGEVEAEGGNWTLSGTIGQWDANTSTPLTGGDWELSGGFWQDEEPAPEMSDRIFSDRFDG